MRRGLLLLLLLFSVLFAEKLEITADTFTAKEVNKRVDFVGNARILQGETSIEADQIVLYFGENNSTKKYRATQNVRFHIAKQKANYKGSCGQVEYFPGQKIYILSKNVILKDRKNHRDITAEKIVIHAKTGAFTITGSKKKTAKLIFDIQ